MDVVIRKYAEGDLAQMRLIWNEVIEEGATFPYESGLAEAEAAGFFAQQTHTAVAEDRSTGSIVGLYVLHPNSFGRCGHIANASYAVLSRCRGQRIGEKLVADSLGQCKGYGFSILQFNAVVANNAAAHRLYKRLGFTCLGRIEKGFRMKDGHYEDIYPYYKAL